MPASSFAAWAILRGGDPFTVIDTSGVWPSLAIAPATGVTLVPLTSTLGLSPTLRATRRTFASALTIWRTALGFVARLWICALPLGERGWPRKTIAEAL